MTVEVLHFRDPDSACDVHVIIDGAEIPMEQIQFVEIDPGCGWDREDWDEHRKTAIADLTSERAKDLVRVLATRKDPNGFLLWQSLSDKAQTHFICEVYGE